MHEVVGLFPNAVHARPGRTATAISSADWSSISARSPVSANNSSANLVHTSMLKPSDSPLLVDAAQLITPLLADFGALLFGERLGWSLKEMWVNVLDTGGRQAMHNHANSFISGVAYLTPHASGRAHGVHEVAGRHRFLVQERPRRREHRARTTPTSGSACRPSPATSCCSRATCMHAVPTNPGERRITLAFNAIPTQLDSWGYKISFSG